MCAPNGLEKAQNGCIALNSSPRENYFRSVGQNDRHTFNALLDILIPCRTFFSVNDQQILFRVLNPAGQNVWQCLSPLPDISRSLPGMSGIFPEN